MLDGGGVKLVEARGAEGYVDIVDPAEAEGVEEDGCGFGVDLGAGAEDGGD